LLSSAAKARLLEPAQPGPEREQAPGQGVVSKIAELSTGVRFACARMRSCAAAMSS
jgi:hypothetical protein